MLTTGLRTIKNLPSLINAKQNYQRYFDAYVATGEPSPRAEKLLLLANWASGGEFPKRYSRQHVASIEQHRLVGFKNDLFAGFDAKATASEVAAVGYAVAPRLIDLNLVTELNRHLNAGPAEPRDLAAGAVTGAPHAGATTWWMKPEVILSSPAFRQLLSEQFPAEVAANYFGGAPMIMSIAMWKSYPSSQGQSASAQQFHYDGDRPLFLKMFLYLDNVTPNNGPHVYVPGTHGKKPKWLLHGARLSDAEIAGRYPEGTWKQICGKQGTLFFADTQGFHKGLHVQTGSRSMLQINISSDRFGPIHPPVDSAHSAPEDIRDLVLNNRRYFTEIYS